MATSWRSTGSSFELARGEVLALLGPNGAGKTTTVETLEGYRRPDAGRSGSSASTRWPSAPSLVASIGAMLQQGGVYPVMTPRQALRLYAAYYDDPLDPEDLLAELGLLEAALAPPGGGSRAASSSAPASPWR